MATNFVQIDSDQERNSGWRRNAAGYARSLAWTSPHIFIVRWSGRSRPEERDRVTILFGGFTWKHEDLIRAVFQGCGYRCEKLLCLTSRHSRPAKSSENNGQCNPTYFTVGNLVQYLQFLEKEGLSRDKILNNYVFFTAGSCGPCRFGMLRGGISFCIEERRVRWLPRAAVQR